MVMWCNILKVTYVFNQRGYHDQRRVSSFQNEDDDGDLITSDDQIDQRRDVQKRGKECSWVRITGIMSIHSVDVLLECKSSFLSSLSYYDEDDVISLVWVMRVEKWCSSSLWLSQVRIEWEERRKIMWSHNLLDKLEGWVLYSVFAFLILSPLKSCNMRITCILMFMMLMEQDHLSPRNPGDEMTSVSKMGVERSFPLMIWFSERFRLEEIQGEGEKRERVLLLLMFIWCNNCPQNLANLFHDQIESDDLIGVTGQDLLVFFSLPWCSWFSFHFWSFFHPRKKGSSSGVRVIFLFGSFFLFFLFDHFLFCNSGKGRIVYSYVREWETGVTIITGKKEEELRL